MNVRLQDNYDDDARDVDRLLHDLAEIHVTKTDRRWEVRCGDCRYLGPWAASVLYSAFLIGLQRNQRPRVKLPKAPPPLVAYCSFSGMSHVFERQPLPNPDHPDCETIPLVRFNEASWNLPDGIIHLLARHTELHQESEDRIRTCVQEVTQNVVDHSRSPIGGVMSARYFENFNEVRVGIVDRGIGIGAALGARHPEVKDSMIALKRVIEGGYSSRSRPNNMGLGVSNLFALVRLVRGDMAIFSGDARAEVHGGRAPNVETLPYFFPGTGVFFTLPIRPET